MARFSSEPHAVTSSIVYAGPTLAIIRILHKDCRKLLGALEELSGLGLMLLRQRGGTGAASYKGYQTT